MPLKSRGQQTSPGNVTSSANTQFETTAAAAKQYRVAPQTLWGVYGTESGYGSNLGPSSAGALGPMQFLISTGQEYGLNSQTIMEFSPSMFAAARYLHNLGADSNPDSPATRAALNGYNGNGQGSSRTSYTDSVLAKGKTYGGPTAPLPSPENQGQTANASFSPLELITGSIDELGARIALASLHVVKDFSIGFGDYIIAPAWHWNQRAVAWYSKRVLNPKRIGDKSQYKWAFAWTAAFWGIGYAILWADPETGNLSPSPVPGSHLARHIRRLQAIPARKSLVKPNQVKKRTAKKPKPRISSAEIKQVDTMTATRPRRVKVTRNADREQTGEPSVIPDGNATTSDVPVQKGESQKINDGDRKPQPLKQPVPHKANSGRGSPLQGGRGKPPPSPKKSPNRRHRP